MVQDHWAGVDHVHGVQDVGPVVLEKLDEVIMVFGLSLALGRGHTVPNAEIQPDVQDFNCTRLEKGERKEALNDQTTTSRSTPD